MSAYEGNISINNALWILPLPIVGLWAAYITRTKNVIK